MPFNANSLNKLQGSAVSSPNERPSGLSNEEVAEIVKNAVRYGTWLYHQAMRQKQAFNLAQGLWKNNYPNDPVPAKEELKARLSDLTDQKTGKNYHDLIGESLRDDWANTDDIHASMHMLEEIAEGTTAPEFVNIVTHTVHELGADYKKAVMMRLMSGETSNNIN